MEMELGELMEDWVRRAVEGFVSVVGVEYAFDWEELGRYATDVKKPADRKDEKFDAWSYGLLPGVIS